MPRVGIIDYGMGNLRSVEKGLQKVGVEAESLRRRRRVLTATTGLVLPGVGAFGDAMDHLRDRGMDRALLEYIERGRHLLGICLGLQLMFEYSEEHGRNEGLGIIPGRVTAASRHRQGASHGLERPEQRKADVPLFDGIESGSRFYFVHSFYCEPPNGTGP